MIRKLNLVKIILFTGIFCFCISCKSKRAAKDNIIVDSPEEMDAKVADNIRAALLYAMDSSGKINDTIQLSEFDLVNHYYEKNDFESLWSSKEIWLATADSLFQFINHAGYYGLYRNDYHFRDLDSLRIRIGRDSLARTDAIAWTKADIMFTDAAMKLLKDLKQGRLVPDSVSIAGNAAFTDSFFVRKLDEIKSGAAVNKVLESVQPENINYQNLRRNLNSFVDNMNDSSYLFLNYPYKDSLLFAKNVYERLKQSGYGNQTIKMPDSLEYTKTVKKYQSDNNLVSDGKVGPAVVKSLNVNDREKFKSIAITLDRYKLLSDMPPVYIWVNIPSFYLKVWDTNSVVLTSKIIVGKPNTSTPIFTSAISDMVTFPKWTIPESIIRKDILPQMKKDPGYLARKGFSLVDYKDEAVDPYSVDWSKYNKGIPWKVVQGSGDDNALGIYKFNFNNPYSVYLHDTNQRYLFSNSNRALSHGCVRVQKWEDLSFFIAKQDSLAMPQGESVAYNADSIRTWIRNKDRKRIMVKKKIPLFIVYFTCEAESDKIIFYDDIYNKDKDLAEKYFSGK